MVCVHAHPDDESSKGAGTMAKYVREGVDVLVVTLTDGSRGSVLNPAMDTPEVLANITEVRAKEMDRAREILGMNRHNTVIYGSGSPHTVFQQFRVIRPLAVDRTLVEIQVFRLKGAPEAVFKRALLYANIVNSPSSNVMPDDGSWSIGK